ncbi:MAG: protein phosphatase 2C domain-containing protein [Myxococcota bacterium]|nr:protein phosphatase 2C domain-containing protein [Myxococcota bacterium]
MLLDSLSKTRRVVCSDSYFSIGHHHHRCEDYTLHFVSEDGCGWGVLSDGCSSSSYSDVGARLLSLSAQQHILLKQAFSERDFDAILTSAEVSCSLLGIPVEALDATVLIGKLDSAGIAQIWGVGDGVLAWVSQKGEFHAQAVRFPSGAPSYLSYRLSEQQMNIHDAINPFCEMHFLNDSTVEQWPAGAWCVELRDVVGLYLFSDGLESFCSEREILSPLEPLQELLRIRSFHGSFVQRRCHRFLNKECSAHGWHHFDDFSMVGIHLGEVYED